MNRTKPASSRKIVVDPPPTSVPFLLSQLGSHVSSTFSDRIAPLGLKPYHAGIIGILGRSAGITQQALADLLGAFPSRVVGLLDELSKLKLIERRESPTDRRTYALHLTKTGRETWAKISKLAEQMEDDLCAGLKQSEREALAGILTRIVAQQKITPGIHPGYRRMETEC